MLGRFTSRRAAVPEPVAPPEPPVALPPEAAPALAVAEPPVEVAAPVNTLLSEKLLDAKVRLHRRLIEEINLSVLEKMPDEEVRRHVHGLVSQYTLAERLALNTQELEDFVAEILDEMTGLGPIEPMLNDILINGHEQVYVERAGVLEPTLVRFKDEAHLLRIVNKIVSAVGRRVDESQPCATRGCSTARGSTSRSGRSRSMARWCRSASSPRSRSTSRSSWTWERSASRWPICSPRP